MEPQNTAGTRVAYLFPGQGTQFVGMGSDLYRAFPSARAVFREIDEALHYPLTRLMFNGPEGELKRTINAQPAILAVSLAFLKAMEEVLGLERMPAPSFVAGHSLGEYTALVAAGALGVAEAARLVRTRGQLMQYASDVRPGGMAAIIGLDELTVLEICRETGAELSIVNADDQIVISGDRLTLARAVDLASLRGARRAVTLQVSGAFHSSLMAPALEGMREALEETPLQPPVVPVVANCSGRPLTTVAEIKEELLTQLCRCVHWKRCVQFMLGAGVGRFLEIGPGRVLTGLVRRIHQQAEVVNISSAEGLKGLAG